MTAGRQLEAEETGATAGVERVEPGSAREDKIEDAVPGGTLSGCVDAVAEVLVKVRCAAIPMGGDLLLDYVRLA